MDELKPELSLKEKDNNEESLVVQSPEAPLSLRCTDTNETELVTGYTSCGQIAEGSSGVVYKARKDADGTFVAIKLFKKDLVPNADAQRRFEQEVETLGKLSHPNIIKILGSGSTRTGIPYIMTEFMDGLSIRSAIDTDGVFEPKRAALIAREICRALTAAHAQSIVHRDLKPNNIIIDGENLAKVVDFGIAKAIGTSSETITQYGAIIGTPAYMSPEQCLGQKVDEKTDIYALGCTLFEMLTGLKAFECASPVEGIAKQISPDRAHIGTRLRSTNAPIELQSIVMKCLKREPADRYRSVAELDHDLSAFLVGTPPIFATASRQSKQLVRVLLAVACIAVAVIVWDVRTMNTQLHTQPNRPGLASMFPWTASEGIEIRNCKTGKVIFSDPTATKLSDVLKEASERKITLCQADLRDAELQASELSSLDLSGADLTGAKLDGAQLTDVDLHDAILTQANLTQSRLLGVNLRNAQMNSAKLIQCNAPATFLDKADLSNAQLTAAQMERSFCTGTNFTRADLNQTNLEQANCTNANFENANLVQTELSEANCSYAKFDRAKMIQTGLKRARLANASFVGVSPTSVEVEGADISQTRLGGIEISDGYMSGSY